ncbi:MAG: SPFH domain-containing protein [Bacteroidaceae bacterium]|nr:SPFH domain-containing protein [Bacteroidaceae bacterium]
MGLFDKLRNELIDIIEWKDETHDTMVWRFPRYQSEIKNGAQLIVRESQVAVLVDEGKFADVFQPGRHELSTANIPILSTIKGWKYGFNSPFKVDVYFVNTKEFLNMKWGTANPITVTDPQLHRAINLRAYGSYNFKISSDPTEFLRKVSGTNGDFDTDAISEMLRSFAVTEFSDYLGEHEVPVVKLASNYKEFSQELTVALKESFKEYGLELTKFLVENISLPEEVRAAIDKGASMAFIGTQDMNTYTQMQFANSLEAGAANPNGGAGAAGSAMGMGMGLAMAQQMAQQMMQPQAAAPQQQGAAVPPPLPQQTMYYVAVNGQQQGPFGVPQLLQMAQQGLFRADSLVWAQGMAGWAAASGVAELAGLFAQTPPPIPPVG